MSSGSGKKQVSAERARITVLLRRPYLELEQRITAGIAAAGFDDIRPAHLQVLQHLPPPPGGIRLTNLAIEANITRQSMHALVTELEKLGYITRTPDPTDRRAAILQRTPKADAIAATIDRALKDAERTWSKHLGKKRYLRLRKYLIAFSNTTVAQNDSA